jgi:hypothetical protein
MKICISSDGHDIRNLNIMMDDGMPTADREFPGRNISPFPGEVLEISR